ncbi:MAG: PucR family transcriptional regulator [Mycobacteriales bacterium]
MSTPKASEPVMDRPTLAGLIEELAPIELQVLSAPRGLDVTVGEPVLYDPLDEASAQANDLVLGVGLDPSSPGCLRSLRALADANACAVILRQATPLTPSSLERADLGIAVLATPAEVSWGQLYTLLRTAMSARASARSSTDSVPIGDLFALANALASMVGGATTIEDPRSQVLAYSSLGHPTDPARREAILGRQVPPDWMGKLERAGVFRRLWQGEDPVEVDDFGEPEMRRRLAIAVRTAGEIIGSIWVVEGDAPLGAEAASALREGARIAAIHLLRHRSSEDLERRRKADALRGLLEGRGAVQAHAQVLGLDVDTTVVVVALAQPPAGEAEATVRAQRAADLVALHFEAYRRRAACAPVGSTVYALLPTAGPGGPERRKELVATVVRRAADSLHVPLRGGIGRPVAGLAEVAVSRREADQAARALLGDPLARSVVDIDEVRARVVLTELAELARVRPELTLGPLGVLAEHDRDKNTTYLATLRAYLDAFGDIALAAETLNVHPNTLRYRVRRLSEISGLDLLDPDERLVAELQLRFLD